MTIPLYEHDCDACLYLGTRGPLEGEPKCNGVDMYYCPRCDGGTIVNRYSSEGADYSSMSVQYPDVMRLPRYAPAFNIARERFGL